MKKILLFIVFFFGSACLVFAGEHVVVAPAFQKVTVLPTDKSVDAQITLKNNTSLQVSFLLRAIDFGTLDDTGGLIFQGQGGKSIDTTYGLSNWLTISPATVTLEPGLQTDITVTITNRSDFSPGGHYAAILATTTSKNAAPNSVQFKQSLSSLLFVTKKGGETYSQSLQSVSFTKSFVVLSDQVGLDIQNSGNVHLTPRGLVQITDPRGVVVKQGVINEDSTLILPGVKRKLEASLHTVGYAWLPGKYHIHVILHSGEAGDIQQTDSTVVYLGIVVPVLLGVLMVIIFIVAYRTRRHWRKRIPHE